MVAQAQRNPGKLNYASQGATSVSFLTTEWFLALAGGLKIAHIPYNGTGPAMKRRQPFKSRMFPNFSRRVASSLRPALARVTTCRDP